MSTGLLPQSFWFRLALRCPKVKGLSSATQTRRVADLPDKCVLPELVRLDGVTPWATARAAWDAGGLALQFSVHGKIGPIVRDPDLPEASDGVQIWIDTRDARDVHRATRFCHHYSATLIPAEGGTLDVDVRLRKIHRAAAEASGARPGAVIAHAQPARKGWRMSLYFPADALAGFEPETNRRLGFTYQVTDPQLGSQWMGAGSAFPIAEDPSLWSTLELVDD